MKLKELMGAKELPIGGTIPEPGTSFEYQTGGWRTFRPVMDWNKCTHCLMCWLYCPDGSVLVKEGKVTGFDLDHCKGCGICAEVCPPKIKAITMVKESEIQESD